MLVCLTSIRSIYWLHLHLRPGYSNHQLLVWPCNEKVNAFLSVFSNIIICLFFSADPCLTVVPPCVTEADRFSLEALRHIHKQLDDDNDGGIEVNESVEVSIWKCICAITHAGQGCFLGIFWGGLSRDLKGQSWHWFVPARRDWENNDIWVLLQVFVCRCVCFYSMGWKINAF